MKAGQCTELSDHCIVQREFTVLLVSYTSKANNNLGEKNKEKIRLAGTEATDEGEGVTAGWSSKDANVQL